MESGNFKDNCQLVVCYNCVSSDHAYQKIQWNSLFPLSMPYVTTLQYREIFWQNGSLLYGSDTAKQEFFMRLQLRLQSLHKHDFISNQLLFYCWLTQHFNFSVSFSFNTLWKSRHHTTGPWFKQIPSLCLAAALAAAASSISQCTIPPPRYHQATKH